MSPTPWSRIRAGIAYFAVSINSMSRFSSSFTSRESHDSTVCYREFSRPCEPGDIPYYPVHLVHEDSMREHYMARARAEKKSPSWAGSEPIVTWTWT